MNIYRNPKTRNWFRYETLFTFLSLKAFRHEERETQSFYADCFYIVSFQPNQRAAPVAHKVVWPCPGLNLSSLVRRQELNSDFSKISKSSAHTSGHDVIYTPLSHFSIWGFYCDISDCHILSARA